MDSNDLQLFVSPIDPKTGSPADLIEIYKDTLLKATEFVWGDSEKVSYPDGFGFDLSEFPIKDGVVEVKETDTISCLQYLESQFSDESIGLLNMADSIYPGGGVNRGARAQEECLFRCSNLAFCLPRNAYPLQNTEMIFTRFATFFKDFNYVDMDPIEAHVLTIAAPKVNKKDDLTTNPDYVKLIRHKIEMMIYQAVKEEVDHLILGAWGCGAFKNNPVYISSVFKEVLEEKAKYFRTVTFAIIQDRNSVGENFKIFKETIL